MREAAKLTTKLHDLIGKADWAQKRADHHWAKAKEYEDHGRIQHALEEKTCFEIEYHRMKCYRQEIQKTEKMIDRLSKVYDVGLEKGVNYAMKKVEEPPSDN